MRAMGVMLLLAALISFLGWIPFSGRDVAEVTPVKLLCLTRTETGIRVTADTGVTAEDTDLRRAFARLEGKTPGHLLLATVDHVTVTGFRPAARDLLACGLRPAAKLYDAPDGIADPGLAESDLATREAGVSLGVLADGGDLAPLPQLYLRGGGVEWEDPGE